MAPPQLFIDTKRLELKLQPDNDENNGCEETGAEKMDSKVADPTGAEESRGERRTGTRRRDLILLPPKLQRRGLVFELNLVTVERV